MAKSKKKKAETNGAEITYVAPEEFVKVWQECETVAEAKEKLGPGAANRAKRMIEAGVNLKKLSSPRARIDVDALNALIK